MSPVSPVPPGYHTLTPHLIVSDAKQAAEFYKKAFGAEIRGMAHGPDGKVIHAEMKIGGIGPVRYRRRDACPDEAQSWKSKAWLRRLGSMVVARLLVLRADWHGAKGKVPPEQAEGLALVAVGEEVSEVDRRCPRRGAGQKARQKSPDDGSSS